MNPLMETLLKLQLALKLAKATSGDELARLQQIRRAHALADAAIWQLEHHPALAKLSGNARQVPADQGGAA